MALPSVTYTFSNSTTADASQVNQNFTDLVNALTDGTKDLSVSALTCAGNVAFNGNITLGNASGDDLTITGSLASTIPIKSTNTYDIGSTTKGLQRIYFGSSAGSNTTRLNGSAVTSDVTLTLPGVTGTLALLDSVASKTSAYTAVSTDGLIKCDSSSAAFTITLPAASGMQGRVLKFLKTDTTVANPVTIDGNSSETIGGFTTVKLYSENEFLEIICDGSNWHIVSRKNNLNYLELNTGNNTGSTSNKIPRFSTTLKNVGSAMSYSDSATLGMAITINESGLFMFRLGWNSLSADIIGFTRNETLGTTGTTTIDSVSTAQGRIAISGSGSVGDGECVYVGYCAVNDVIRPHINVTTHSTADRCYLQAVKLDL